jgi:hypothetical protein
MRMLGQGQLDAIEAAYNIAVSESAEGVGAAEAPSPR